MHTVTTVTQGPGGSDTRRDMNDARDCLRKVTARIDAKVRAIDDGAKVSRETMELEFVV